MVQVPRHIHVIVGMGPILLPDHSVYIQLYNNEVLQHIKVYVTHNDSHSEKEWSANLCSAYCTENIHLWIVLHV
jgi:hypothetical protein